MHSKARDKDYGGQVSHLKHCCRETPEKRYTIEGVFTWDRLSLVGRLTQSTISSNAFSTYMTCPLVTFYNVQPQILIGTDNHHLTTPVESVHLGSKRSPLAMNTRLGWALHAPAFLHGPKDISQCLFTSAISPYIELKCDVNKLWQVDIIPYRNEKLTSRSKQDKEVMELLEKSITKSKCRWNRTLLNSLALY